MTRLEWPLYSKHSFFFALMMSFTTLVHHLHAFFALGTDGDELHVVLIEVVMIPLTVATMIIFLRDQIRYALWVYIGIVILGFIGLGLFEGGWNHTAKIIGYLRIEGASTEISDILPPNDLNLWFYEITGLMTFIFAMFASAYTLKFWCALPNHR